MIEMKSSNWTGFNIVSNEGCHYNGDTKNGVMHGKGKCTYKDGSTYEGQWVNGLYCGEGTLSLPSGHRYIGGWQDGMRHGDGTIILPDKTKIRCAFSHNQKNGLGHVTHPNGAVEEVLFIHDMESKMSDQNPDCYLKAPLNLLLCCLAMGAVIAGVVYQGPFSYMFFIVAAGFYVGMIFETYRSGMNSYSNNLYSV